MNRISSRSYDNKIPCRFQEVTPRNIAQNFAKEIVTFRSQKEDFTHFHKQSPSIIFLYHSHTTNSLLQVLVHKSLESLYQHTPHRLHCHLPLP